MGARTQAEAQGFLVAQMRRRWGVVAARASAHLRVTRAAYIGMTASAVQSLRRVARDRPPVDPAVFMAGIAPAIDRRRGA